MGRSAAAAGPMEETEVTPSPPDAKRRRCVQSKLSWAVPKAVEAEDKADESGREGKVAVKSTPRKCKGRSKAGAAKKSPVMNGEATGLPAIDKDGMILAGESPQKKRCGDATVQEKNSVLPAGKKMHPFFSCWMESKSMMDVQDMNVEGRHTLCAHGKAFACCPPIHVVDTSEPGISFDWSKWVFSEGSHLETNETYPVESAQSVLEGLVRPLALEATDCVKMYLDRLSDTRGAMATGAANNLQAPWSQHQTMKLFSHSEIDDGNSYSFPPACGDFISMDEHQSIESFLPDCCLWTSKYSPENASQVCGNSESVMFLSEWLKNWHESGRRSSKSCRFSGKNVNEDSENSLYEDESDTDDMDDATDFQNVLLMTGPVGSGKSAAVYACAREQGFYVVEVNASDVRNGHHIRQKFGEATESHGLSKWSRNEETIGSGRNDIPELGLGTFDSREDKNLKNFVIDVASNGCHHEETVSECSWCVKKNNSMPKHVSNKTLILFEEVDTLFDEDRGFISTILQLAGTTKWPIILTSNNKKPTLPPSLSQQVLEFKHPTSKDLISHVNMICTNEKVNLPIPLMKHAVKCCLGDIRRTIMFLQFWCQGRRDFIDRDGRCFCGTLPFDLDAMHSIMPRVFPWEFPCKLSEKVLEDINQILSLLEEQVRQLEATSQDEPDSKQIIESPPIRRNASNSRKTKRKAKLKRDCSASNYAEHSTHENNLDDFNDAPDTLPSDQRRAKNRCGIVLSSDSDGDLKDEHLPKDPILADPRNHLAQDTLALPNLYLYEASCPSELPTDLIHLSPTHICDTFMLQDVSIVPESSFMCVSEPRKDYLLTSVTSSDYISLIDADITQSMNRLPDDIGNLDLITTESNRYLEPGICDTCEVDVESIHGNEELGSCQDGDEPTTSRYHLMDECSRAESMWPSSKKCSKNHLEIGSVQDAWNKLRGKHQELKSHFTNNKNRASEVLKLAASVTELISETDVMFTSCDPIISDVLDPSVTPHNEPDVFSWYAEQHEMGSVYAQHGLCFYTRSCVNTCSDMDESSVDLSQEMLTSSTNFMALGKLCRMGVTNSEMSHNRCLHTKEPGCRVSLKRERDSGLYDAILPIIPAKLSLSIKGPAFHEYLSFMSQISKLDFSRLTESETRNSKRRSRGSHYLSSGKLSLPLENVELLARSSCFDEAPNV